LSRYTVFVPEPIAPAGMHLLGQHCDIIAPWQTGQPAGEIPLEADAALVRIYRVDAERMEAAPNLRVVAKHGVGLDNIDIPSASARHIAVLWTPEANAEGVAQHAIALMLALTNKIKEADAGVRTGRFDERMAWGSIEISERTLGIIGLGRIGRRTAHKAALGLGMNVLAYDPYVDRIAYDGPAVFVDELDELLRRADVVTLHVPLTDETRHIIDGQSIAHMRPESYLINTARGAAVDEKVLAEALSAGRLAGAAIDVFAQEPPDPAHPLQSAPNALLTPHVAGLSDRALIRVATEAAKGILDVLQGRHPCSPVNPEILPLQPR